MNLQFRLRDLDLLEDAFTRPTVPKARKLSVDEPHCGVRKFLPTCLRQVGPATLPGVYVRARSVTSSSSLTLPGRGPEEFSDSCHDLHVDLWHQGRLIAGEAQAACPCRSTPAAVTWLIRPSVGSCELALITRARHTSTT